MGSEEKPEFITLANVIPMGFEQLTGIGGLSLTPPAGTDKALIQVEGTDARLRDDGTDPTAAVGVRLKTSDPPFVYESDLSNVKFIRILPVAMVINILYYKNKGSN